MMVSQYQKIQQFKTTITISNVFVVSTNFFKCRNISHTIELQRVQTSYAAIKPPYTKVNSTKQKGKEERGEPHKHSKIKLSVYTLKKERKTGYRGEEKYPHCSQIDSIIKGNQRLSYGLSLSQISLKHGGSYYTGCVAPLLYR